MAHAKLDMEDSDSEYDPSKIPANPPKTTVTTRPPPETLATSSLAPSEALAEECKKDWTFVDHVCSKPMFAPTHDIEIALDLIRKWSDGAEARYGTDIMAYLRRNIVGPAVDARQTELQRILALRKQTTNGDRSSEAAQDSPYTQANTLPPIKQRPDDFSPPSNVRPMLQNGTDPRTFPPLSKPSPYNGTVDKRPGFYGSSASAPQVPASQSRLPPMQAEPPRPVNGQFPAQQAPSYPSQTAAPISRGRNWIFSSDSELWCPMCKCGPLSCIHNHRLIARLFSRGIKQCALEELQYTYDQLQNWAYRGHPLKMEPAMTKLYSLEELAAEQKGWISELRLILGQLPSNQSQQPHLPRPAPHQQQTYPHPGSSQQSTPVIHSRPFPESRTEDRVSHPPVPVSNYNTHAKGTPGPFTYSTPTSMRSPAAQPPRVFEQGICNMCPRNGICVHQRDDKRSVVASGDRSPKQNHAQHKRKRSTGTSLTERRIKMSFRQQTGDSVSSDEDDVEDEEGMQGFLQAYGEQAYQKFNHFRSMVETIPKDQLSTAVLRMCYSNHMALNWMNKELKKPELPREIVVTGEASLITPTSPESPVAKQIVSSPEQHTEKQILHCSQCQATFDPASATQNRECQWHDGDLIQNSQTGITTNRIWQDNATTATAATAASVTTSVAANRVWTCCGGEMSAKGCRSGKHSTQPPVKVAPRYPDRSTVSTLTNIVAGRPPMRHHSNSYSSDVSLYPGHMLVKALADAEKESEKATLQALPSLRRLSLAANDNDYRSFQDFCPSLKTLDDIPAAAFELESRDQHSLDLSNDPQQNLLHGLELRLASQLRLDCATYLCEKRRMFQAVLEAMQDGSEFTSQNAQSICRIEASKTDALFSVFERIGWFEPRHFMKFLNDPSGSMIDSIERSLPGIHDLPLNGHAGGRPSSCPDTSGQLHIMARRASSGSASAPVISLHHQLDDRLRKQRKPMHLPHASALFQPLHVSGHLHAPLHYANGHHVGQGHNTITLTDMQLSPPRDVIMAGSPETYQWRKNGSGKKMQVPICPYPRSWAEADAVDRELVRLKRHEGKQWEELFEWWRGKGRASLKNASCLAVRYSILKKNYEADWVREGL